MSRDFFKRLQIQDQALLNEIGRPKVLEPRQHLMRRGETDGDLYRIEEGELEVVDSSSRPVVILDRVGKGEILGELAFVDGTPRSADVVAVGACRVTHWTKAALMGLIAGNPSFAANFWHALAEAVALRLRLINSSTTAVRKKAPLVDDGANAGESAIAAQHLGDAARDELVGLARELQKDPSSQEILLRIDASLDHLVHEVEAIAANCPDRGHQAKTWKAASREVMPFLLQAATANLSISRAGGHCGDGSVMGHILGARPRGDGPLGRAIDSWLLRSPLAEGLRSRQGEALSILRKLLGGVGDSARLMVINGATGGLTPLVHRALEGRGGSLVVVEANRDLLEESADRIADYNEALQVQYVTTTLWDLHEVRHFRNQDLVILDGLLEYYPAGVATRVLRFVRGLLGEQGRCLATGLVPSPDAHFWEHMLDWPTIRRTQAQAQEIAQGADYRFRPVTLCKGAGMVLLTGNSATRKV